MVTMMMTVATPEGDVTLRGVDDLHVVHTRVLRVKLARLGEDRFWEILVAATNGARTTEDLAERIGFTPQEEGLLSQLWDATIWALLADWDIPDRLLPAGPEDVAELPTALRDALLEAIGSEASTILLRMI